MLLRNRGFIRRLIIRDKADLFLDQIRNKNSSGPFSPIRRLNPVLCSHVSFPSGSRCELRKEIPNSISVASSSLRNASTDCSSNAWAIITHKWQPGAVANFSKHSFVFVQSDSGKDSQDMHAWLQLLQRDGLEVFCLQLVEYFLNIFLDFMKSSLTSTSTAS
jgi:hypothetical protein